MDWFLVSGFFSFSFAIWTLGAMVHSDDLTT